MDEGSLVEAERGELAPPGLFWALYPVSLSWKYKSCFWVYFFSTSLCRNGIQLLAEQKHTTVLHYVQYIT